MATECLPQVQGCAMRVAVLNAQGIPLPGANNLYTTDAFTLVDATPVYTDGDEIKEKNACGTVCVNTKGDDSLDRVDVGVTICTHDPYLMQMLGGGDVLTSGGAHGWALPAIGALTSNGVSIEVWAKRIKDGDLDPDFPYAWWVLPKVKNLRFGQRKFENGPALPQFTGRGYENANWYNGPLNNWPVASDRALQYFPVSSLPTLTCGPTALAAS